MSQWLQTRKRSRSQHCLEGLNLSEDQMKCVTKVGIERRSTVLTGPAGSGKSYVIRALQQTIPDASKLCLTAMTGVAATHLSGASTLHSWAGIRQGADINDDSTTSRESKQRWRNAEVLVIDEASMMSSSFLERLDVIGRRVRKNNNPFGGLCIVLCGDFLVRFQLNFAKKRKLTSLNEAIGSS